MLKEALLAVAFSWLQNCGYDMEHKLEPYQRISKHDFFAAEATAKQRYEALPQQEKLARPARLDAAYAQTPVLGRVRVSDAVAELATIIDPLDPYLGCLTQLTHQLQVAEQMERDGVDETFLTFGLIHDLGKLLLKHGDEDPINVEAGGKKAPLAGTPGCGLLNCTFRWDHGDFGYLRIKDHAPFEVSWLMRHHSLDLAACAPYMDERDRQLTERLLIPFMRYDERKDMFALPRRSFEQYRPLIDRMFPEPILI